MILYRYCCVFIFVIMAVLCSCPAGAVTSEKWVLIKSATQGVRQAFFLGESRPAHPVDIVVALYPRNKQALGALSDQILINTSGPRLTSDEFMTQYAPTEEQAQAVADYLRLHKFDHVNIASNRLLISAQGNPEKIKTAFNTDLHFYLKNDRIVHDNIEPASVPERFAGVISAVVGLQTKVMDEIAYRRSGPYRQRGTTYPENTDADSVKPHFLTEFPLIYNAHKLSAAVNSAIGIIADGNLDPVRMNLRRFAASSGFPVSIVRTIPVGEVGEGATEHDIAWSMVTQAALAAAGGAVREMLLYNVPSLSHTDMLRAFNQVVIDNQVRVINVSAGSCESIASASGYDTVANTLFQVGIVQGQTFVAATGNTGGNRCRNNPNEQFFPASSPYVIAVGGTSLSTTLRNEWHHEVAWKYTGGGLSIGQRVPEWQIASGAVPGTMTTRSLPDIVFNANPDSGAYITVDGSDQIVGGTSLSASLFTGFWARILSAYGDNLPFPAPLLYMGARSNPHWFHDITSGSAENSHGVFYARMGWDYASGLGSIDIGAFAAAFRDDRIFRPATIFLADKKPHDGLFLVKGSHSNYCFHVPYDAMDLFNRNYSSLFNHHYRENETSGLTFELYNGTGNGSFHLPPTDIFTEIIQYSQMTDKTGNKDKFTYHSIVHGYTCVTLRADDTISNASLRVSYQPAQPSQTLVRGHSVKEINMGAGQGRIYTFKVPKDKSNLIFRRTGGTGDVDLYVRLGSAPSTRSHSFFARSGQPVVIPRPRAGTYYVLLNANAKVSDATLIADYDDDEVTGIENK